MLPLILTSPHRFSGWNSVEQKQTQLVKGWKSSFGRTTTVLCPVSAILHYLSVCPNHNGPLLIHADGSPLSREQFVRMVKTVLSAAKINSSSYSRHSFWIGAATAAAAVGVLTHFIKMLERWQSKEYQLYVHIPWKSLAVISQLIT